MNLQHREPIEVYFEAAAVGVEGFYSGNDYGRKDIGDSGMKPEAPDADDQQEAPDADDLQEATATDNMQEATDADNQYNVR